MSDKLPLTETIKPEEILDYKNPDLSIEDRVADLIEQMTLEEKAAQMLCVWGQKRQSFHKILLIIPAFFY
jgi:hypothetical protein